MLLRFGSLVLLTIAAFAAPLPEQAPLKRKVEKTDAEWRKLLTPDQYMVLRLKATEPAFTGKYADHHARGIYCCAGCGAELFSSRAKFESGTGWPSFYQPFDPKRIQNAPDYEMAVPRVEVMCADCGGHLGHVFSDGPPPTGLRYCINSAALKFKPDKTAARAGSRRSTKGKAAGTSKTPARSKTAQASPDGEGRDETSSKKSEK